MKYILLFVLGITTFLSGLECEDFKPNHALLKQAWKYHTGGGKKPHYYSLQIDNHNYLGGRPWNTRWNLLKDAVDYEGKRVLELGCNTALASIFIKKFRNAQECVGVDFPVEDLIKCRKGKQLVAHELISQAFDTQITMKHLNLNTSNYEEELGYDFDIVYCLSLIKWMANPERLMNYLSNFDHVIFEGHKSDSAEIARFAEYGFTNYEILGSTQIGIGYGPNQRRTLIHFYK